MPDAWGRFKGAYIPSTAKWPPKRPTPGGYVPPDAECCQHPYPPLADGCADCPLRGD